MKDYRNSVSLQPSSYGFLRPLFKGEHVLGQKEAVRQTLCNTTPFTFIPNLYTSARGERLAVQLKLGLPRLRCLRRGCHALPDLDLQLLNDNTVGWSGRSSGHCISQTSRSMIDNALPLSGSSGLGRRWRGRCLTLDLRWLLLRGLPCTGHKTVYSYGLPGHHISSMIRLGIKKVSNINGKLIGCLRRSLGFSKFFGLCGFLLDRSFFLNRCVSKFSNMLGHALCQLVPQQHKLV